MKRGAMSWVLTMLVSGGVAAQTPQPFPRPGESSKPQPNAPSSSPPKPPDTQGLKVLPPETKPSPAQPGEPTELTLGVPLYPNSQFIASYDAGRGQRYYLYGINSDFATIVAFYRTVLKQRGELVFEVPPIHMFELGRFREETMAFPPSVTVKDYSPDGYLALKAGAQAVRYRTVLQIVPNPPVPPIK
jgi:hypothetical protein